ncbi:MAG: FAD-dependent oxidoreductase [Bacilli bacterium]|jgi:thioredoxin reductase (NADPH)
MTINKDILIIGAGPAGVGAAIYLSRSKYSFCIVEKEMIGGKLNTITQIDNYPGFVSISGVELIQKYQEQLKARNIEVLHDGINGITKGNDLFQVVGDNNTYIVKTIIIATGSSNKRSGVPGEREYQGKGISYCAVCDGFFYRNKDVLVFAHDAKGYKEALYLENLVNKIYLVNDNNIDDNDNDLATLKKSKKVEFFYPFVIKEFLGNEEGLTGVVIKDNTNNIEKNISCIGAFPFVGDTPSSYFLMSLGLKMDGGYIDVDSNCESSIKGVFAVGDIVHKSLKQIVTASSDGAIAATSAIRYLNSKK